MQPLDIIIPMKNVRHPTTTTCCLLYHRGWKQLVFKNVCLYVYARCFVQCDTAHCVIKVLFCGPYKHAILCSCIIYYIHTYSTITSIMYVHKGNVTLCTTWAGYGPAPLLVRFRVDVQHIRRVINSTVCVQCALQLHTYLVLSRV